MWKDCHFFIALIAMIKWLDIFFEAVYASSDELIIPHYSPSGTDDAVSMWQIS